MDIYKQLPTDISSKLFRYFRHPVADLVKLHYRSPQIRNLLEDICDYHCSLKKLYILKPPDHTTSEFGRATLLNHLWISSFLLTGSYYKIWQRMFRINSEARTEFWIRHRYACRPHKFQINCLWALFTPPEREDILRTF